MRRFAEDIDQLFDGWFGGTPAFGRGDQPRRSAWWPQVEARQERNTVTVSAALPGLRKEDVTVEVDDDDVLTIKGERRQDQQRTERVFRHSERSYGSFYRAIRLPRGADPAKATAQFRNGVLTVTMPAPGVEQRGGRRIAIQGESPTRGSAMAEDQPHGKAV
jgi:HSP20 family protein